MLFCIIVHFSEPGDSVFWLVYIASSMLGVGCTILLVTSLTMTTDLIDGNRTTSAFVFGFMSLLDKLSNGIVVQIISSLEPDTAEGRARFYRSIEVYAIGGFLFTCGALLILRILLARVFNKREQSQNQLIHQTNL
ncbi:unnamed protein product [Protopolystoma xenopodis]|uniref:Major facilitator superfamily (MFS) profile domain-containing protein n=1 Tax=Protopolystoma xenopodis TaxID=117903 RepID=A0A448XD35_9PLAT|nr:unnamed protein product [Protopolystoma xenopodis]